jgi:hypothetical protein
MQGKNAKLAPTPQRIPNVKYNVDRLGAKDEAKSPTIEIAVPKYTIFRQPKCSHMVVVIGPMKNWIP